MEKINMFKELKEYKATQKPRVIETTQCKYLTVKGCGEPGGENFTEAVGALYAAAYTIKMTRKGGDDPD